MFSLEHSGSLPPSPWRFPSVLLCQGKTNPIWSFQALLELESTGAAALVVSNPTPPESFWRASAAIQGASALP